jgi:phage terminase large subunit-like protein
MRTARRWPNGSGSASPAVARTRSTLDPASADMAQLETLWGDEENRGAHPAIVDEDLWRAAQVRVRSHPGGRRRDTIALLHGIIRCAGCRFQMSRALTNSQGYARDYYHCRAFRVSGRCPSPAAVRADREDGLEA